MPPVQPFTSASFHARPPTNKSSISPTNHLFLIPHIRVQPLDAQCLLSTQTGH